METRINAWSIFEYTALLFHLDHIITGLLPYFVEAALNFIHLALYTHTYTLFRFITTKQGRFSMFRSN